jgi:hypothetical protein
MVAICFAVALPGQIPLVDATVDLCVRPAQIGAVGREAGVRTVRIGKKTHFDNERRLFGDFYYLNPTARLKFAPQFLRAVC